MAKAKAAFPTTTLTPEMEQAAAVLKNLSVPFTPMSDGTLAAKGNVHLDQQGLTELPDLSCVVLDGSFYCHGNNLMSLKGAPKIVKKDFYCFHNELMSLEHAPERVGGNFLCHHNNLRTLEGAPDNPVDFKCYSNPLESLEGGPHKVRGDYSCLDCHLSTLKGAPAKAKEFICLDNPLRNLEFAPQQFTLLKTAWGSFVSWKSVPETLKMSTEALVEKATILSRPVSISKPLTLKR